MIGANKSLVQMCACLGMIWNLWIYKSLNKVVGGLKSLTWESRLNFGILFLLMKQMIIQPDRVVNVMEVRSMRGVRSDSHGVIIGATTTLDELIESPRLDEFPAIKQAASGISSLRARRVFILISSNVWLNI